MKTTKKAARLAAALANIAANQHCSSCGVVTDEHDGDGYATCCGKPLCSGTGYPSTYGNDKNTVQACCWGEAEAKFAAKGIEVVTGMSCLSY